MSKYKPKVHLYWFTTRHQTHYRTACGKWMPHNNTTQVIDHVTCKNCLATVYGRPERNPT